MSIVRCFAVVSLCFAVLAISVVAVDWECRLDQDVKGYDLYKDPTIENSLDTCKGKCQGQCEFVVYKVGPQTCFQKRSWDNGPDGKTGPEMGTTACRKSTTKTERP